MNFEPKSHTYWWSFRAWIFSQRRTLALKYLIRFSAFRAKSESIFRTWWASLAKYRNELCWSGSPKISPRRTKKHLTHKRLLISFYFSSEIFHKNICIFVIKPHNDAWDYCIYSTRVTFPSLVFQMVKVYQSECIISILYFYHKFYYGN